MWRQPIRLGGGDNKYGAKSTFYNGVWYDSVKEATRGFELEMLKKGKVIKDYDRQFPVELYVNGTKICTHKVDFRVHHFDGTFELEEVKGFATPEWRLKKKLLEAAWLPENPKYRYTVIW